MSARGTSRKCRLRRVRAGYGSKADSGKPPQGVFARQFQLTHQLENLLAFHRSSSAGCRIGRDSPPAHAAGAVRQE